MIVDFEKETEKKIDYCVKQIDKTSNIHFTKGAIRTFVVETILSSLSEKDMIKIILSQVKKES